MNTEQEFPLDFKTDISAPSCWDSSDGPSIWSSLYPIAVKIFLALILIKTSILVFIWMLKSPWNFKLFQRYLPVRECSLIFDHYLHCEKIQ